MSKGAVLLAMLLVTACGASTPAAVVTSSSGSRTHPSGPSPSPSASPPVASALAVMVNSSTNTQTVSLVDRGGKVVASVTVAVADVEPVPFPGTATATLQGGPPGIGGICCGVALPELSTTADRVYFLSGQDQVHFLGADGSTGLAMTLPNVKGRTQAVFAVSSDDRQVALSVFDWSTKPMKMTISVEDLDGTHRADIFSSTSVYEWPVAWRAGRLVLAVGSVLGGPPNPYAAVSYHVADPKTGKRLAELGSTACQAIGPLVQAGTLCNRVCTGGDVHNPPPGSQVCLDAVDWSGKQQTLYRYISSENIGTWAALSPDGSAAVVDESAQQPSGESVVKLNKPPVVIGPVDTPYTWWLDEDTVVVYGTHKTGTNGAFYRLSSTKLVPLSDDLGSMEGVIPGVS